MGHSLLSVRSTSVTSIDHIQCRYLIELGTDSPDDSTCPSSGIKYPTKKGSGVRSSFPPVSIVLLTSHMVYIGYNYHVWRK